MKSRRALRSYISKWVDLSLGMYIWTHILNKRSICFNSGINEVTGNDVTGFIYYTSLSFWDFCRFVHMNANYIRRILPNFRVNYYRITKHYTILTSLNPRKIFNSPNNRAAILGDFKCDGNENVKKKREKNNKNKNNSNTITLFSTDTSLTSLRDYKLRENSLLLLISLKSSQHFHCSLIWLISGYFINNFILMFLHY